MIDFLRRLLRRIATVAALLFGVAVAALFTALALASALTIGAAFWLANRFGLRARRAPPGRAAQRGSEVIDVEMREVEPDATRGPEPEAGEEAGARQAAGRDDDRRGA